MRAALALGLVLAAPAGAEPLRIGIALDYPPYLFRQADGTLAGFDADLMAEICARGPFECSWVELPLTDLLAAVRDGRVDVAASGIGANDEREAFMDFTCPYYIADSFTGSMFARSEGVDVTTVPIAVMGQSLYDKAMRDAGFATRPYPDETAAIRTVIAGEVEAFFGSNQMSTDLTQGLHFIGEYRITTSGPALGVGENADALRNRLDHILADLSQEGRLAAMQRAWLDVDQGDVIARCTAAFPQA
jgi:polar amino acid transport system substrate-binding protein